MYNNIFFFRRSMVEGAQKRKTLRLMTIIIVMFLLCHLPKVDPREQVRDLFDVIASKHSVGKSKRSI